MIGLSIFQMGQLKPTIHKPLPVVTLLMRDNRGPVYKRATMMQTGSKEEVTKLTDKHAAECLKAVHLGVNLSV